MVFESLYIPTTRRGGSGIRAHSRSALCLTAWAWLALIACSTSRGPAAPDEHAADRATLLAYSERFETALAKQGLVYGDPELATYLDSIVGPLAAQSLGDPGRFRLAVLRDPTPNALALPNGAIYVSVGALAAVDDESQLALLLAHEMNHVELDHALRGMTDRRSKTIAAKVTEVALGPLLGLTNLGFAAAIAGYSREMEEEADRAGMEWIARAGFVTASAPRLFAALNAAQKQPGGGIWSDHPANDARAAYCAELATSGRVAANPGGRNDAARLRIATERVSLESLRLRVASGQYEAASEEVERALARYGESAPLRFYEGESALRRIDARKPTPTLADAERSFRRALELDPAYGAAHRGLAEVLLRNGDRAGAEATLKEYLDANPGARDERLVQRMLRRIRASAAPDEEGEP